MVQMGILSSYSRMLENWVWPQKCMLSRNITTVETKISNCILEVPVVENHPARIKVERNVVIVVVPTSKGMPCLWQGMLQMQEEESFLKTLLKFQIRSQVEGGNPKHFSRKDVHKVENTKFEYDTDIVESKWIQFCVDFSFCCIIKQLVDSLEQNIGCWRQAFIQPTAGCHQVWGRTEMLHLRWTLRGSVNMLRTCEILHWGVWLV